MSCSWDDLPEDLEEKIVSEMDEATLKQFGLVSKHCSSFLQLPGRKSLLYKLLQEFYQNFVTIRPGSGFLWNLLFRMDKDKGKKAPLSPSVRIKGWEDLYTELKKSLRELKNTKKRKSILSHVQVFFSLTEYLPFFVILLGLIMSSFVLDTVSTSLFLPTVVSTAITLLIILIVVTFWYSIGSRDVQWIRTFDDLMFSFSVCVYYPLLLLSGMSNWIFYGGIFLVAMAYILSCYFLLKNSFQGSILLVMFLVVPFVLKIVEHYFRALVCQGSLVYYLTLGALGAVYVAMASCVAGSYIYWLDLDLIHMNRGFQDFFLASPLLIYVIAFTANWVLKLFHFNRLLSVLLMKTTILFILIFLLTFYYKTVSKRHLHRQEIEVLVRLKKRLVG